MSEGDDRCHICKRLLNQEADPFSGDCGGDCALCMLEIEADIGDYKTALNIANSIAEHIKGLDTANNVNQV